MDHGFAPAADRHNANLRIMFTNRPATKLVHRRGLATIAEFIDHLGTAPTVNRPIGDLIVGTHAGSKGFLSIPLSRGQRGRSDFEAFEDARDGTSDSVQVPDSLIGFSTGDPITHSFHIKGCNVGRNRSDTTRTPAAPFLIKIKEALGGHVSVTAPKHFHGLDPAPGLGIFEYMAYEFKLGVLPTLGPRRRLRGFVDQAAALAAFRAGGFRYIDGTPVPNDDWIPLIPKDITTGRDQTVKARLGVTVGTRKTMNVRRQFRVDTDDVLWTLDFPDATDIPADEAGRLAALRLDMPRDDRFKAAHPFPQYERLGFKSFNDFFAGYRWTFRVRRNVLVCTGLRFHYTVLLPITNRTTGNVVFNFYPNDTTAATIRNLEITNAAFFTRV